MKYLLMLLAIAPLFVACDGVRSIRADINLKNEVQYYDYPKVTSLIDNIAARNNLKCNYKYDDYFRSCDLYSVHLVSRIDTKTGIFAIDMSEFGPIGATKQYELLGKDITNVIKTNFKKESVVWNPERCRVYFEKEFFVKLNSNRPKALYFIPWSVESEFNKTISLIASIARNNGMKDSGCYPMKKTDRCVSFVGGDYIGVWESVRYDVLWDSASQVMRVEVTDRSCKESELAKLIYDETLTQIKELYGEEKINIPINKNK